MAERRRLWDEPWAWTLLALALRVGFALLLGERQYQTDEASQAAAAWSLAHFHVLGFGGVAKAMPPLPGAFYAPWFAVFGQRWLAPRLAQACVAGLFPLVLYEMSWRLLESREGARWALRLAAVYPFYVYYSGMLMTETLDVFLSASGLLLLCLSLKDRGGDWRLAAGAGLCASLASLTRMEGAIVFLVLLTLVGLFAAVLRYSRLSWLVATVFFALPLMGIALRDYARTGALAVDNHGGITFYTGTALFQEGEVDTTVAMKRFYAGSLWPRIKDLDAAAADRECYRAAVTFMRENPALTLWQWWRKSVNFWRLYPRVDKVYAETTYSHPGLGLKRGMLVAISLLFEPALIFGGAYGFWRERRRVGYTFLIPLFILGIWAAHVLTVSMMRYRLPVMAYFILFLGASLPRRAET